jgi:hypothetical protein
MASQLLGRGLSRRIRRRQCELRAARREVQDTCDSQVQEEADLRHGLEELPPALPACCRECLGDRFAEADTKNLSDSARRQRRHRLKMKLQEQGLFPET